MYTTEIPVLRTERLLLRAWNTEDLSPFAALNADAAVVEHLPGLLTPEESDALVTRIKSHFAKHNFGFWAVEEKASGRFIGFTGLSHVHFVAHFTPCVETGWRLARHAWGQGYATEAAKAAAEFAFDHLNLQEITSFTVPANHRSQRVMQKLGMQHDPTEDFDHPGLPAGHPLRRHVLYRLSRTEKATPQSS